MAFIMPPMALLTLVYLFGFYAIAEGVFSLVAAFQRSGEIRQRPWWALMVQGFISIIAGLIALFLPGITAIALLYVIAGWALATGVLEIVAAIRLRQQVRGEWLLALAGVLSIALGLLLAFFPKAGALAMVLWIGAYAFIVGILLIALGLRLRKWLRKGDHYRHAFSEFAPGH